MGGSGVQGGRLAPYVVSHGDATVPQQTGTSQSDLFGLVQSCPQHDKLSPADLGYLNKERRALAGQLQACFAEHGVWTLTDLENKLLQQQTQSAAGAAPASAASAAPSGMHLASQLLLHISSLDCRQPAS